MNHIELLLFDLDNTLYPFNEYWDQANFITFSQSYLTRNLPYSEFILQFKRNDKYYWKLHYNKQISLAELRQQRLIQTLKNFGLSIGIEAANEHFNLFFSNLMYLIKPNEAINTYLKELRNTYKIGIITNGNSYEQKQKLERLHIHHIFENEEIFISEETGLEKPDPKAFLVPLSKYKVKPNQTVYIGDSWENDIVGSINAGINAIWVNPNSNIPTTEHKPLFIIDEILSLKEKNYL